jgi:hypothetical protein
MQTPEQDLIAREQFRQGIQKQTLAETAWAGEKICLAFPDHAQGESGLIDVIAVVFPDFTEGLDANGQFLARHGRLMD